MFYCVFRALEVMRFIENDATLLSLKLRDIARSAIDTCTYNYGTLLTNRTSCSHTYIHTTTYTAEHENDYAIIVNTVHYNYYVETIFVSSKFGVLNMMACHRI